MDDERTPSGSGTPGQDDPDSNGRAWMAQQFVGDCADIEREQRIETCRRYVEKFAARWEKTHDLRELEEARRWKFLLDLAIDNRNDEMRARMNRG